MRGFVEFEDYDSDRGDCAPPVRLPPRGAAYRCLQCDHAWQASAGSVQCPSCGHDYVRWLNQ